MRRTILNVMAGGLLLAGLYYAGGALMMPAKAMLAQHLIERSWEQTLQGDGDARPWPWMDSAPVAKLSVPRLEKEFVIMRGTSGAVLAFAPGWHDGTDLPGREGISLISAHRDTHFGFLQALKIGDVVRLQSANGSITDYRIEELKSVMEPEIQVSRNSHESVLLLSTCYPFSNWQPGGEMRFVVVARRIPGGASVRTAALDINGLSGGI